MANNEVTFMEKLKEEVSGQDSVIIKKETKESAKNKENLEVGGRGGLDPSRFGDWEIAGKCVDF